MCIACFLHDKVGSPKDRFSHDTADILTEEGSSDDDSEDDSDEDESTSAEESESDEEVGLQE